MKGLNYTCGERRRPAPAAGEALPLKGSGSEFLDLHYVGFGKIKALAQK
jgi:hypothetical protein